MLPGPRRSPVLPDAERSEVAATRTAHEIFARLISGALRRRLWLRHPALAQGGSAESPQRVQ